MLHVWEFPEEKVKLEDVVKLRAYISFNKGNSVWASTDAK